MWVIFKNLISLDVDKFGHVVLVNKFVLKNIFNSNFLELGCPQKLLNLILNDFNGWNFKQLKNPMIENQFPMVEFSVDWFEILYGPQGFS